ncbi:VanZ family protein [Paenibacillus sp. YYML68]|uniref:VanZ family protein n=1 Tax=Paenibacillus sp. YYML68 TaxID=2909250 RepID=UPI00249024FB|nr:VanZ family protein [Paenibacillus sp. YYML68]
MNSSKWLRWLPSILWMAAIFYFSSRTGGDLGGWLDAIQRWIPMMAGFDWGHFVSYFILALTYLWGLRPTVVSWAVKGLVVLLCLLYGVSDELHQAFVPGRTPDVYDLRNDTIGAVLAMLVCSVPAVRRFFEPKR